jgi:hypothetical protein
MRNAFVLIAVLALTHVATAGPFGLVGRKPVNTNQQPQQTRFPVAYGAFSSAQGVANHMATVLRIGHWGGNAGYEGCGCGATPHAAEMNCCFRNRMQPREVGIARGANGMYYACCRY